MNNPAVFVKGRRLLVGAVAGLVLGAVVLVSMTAAAGSSLANDGANTQTARLLQLQAAFHGALSAPAPGEPDDVAQRIEDVLALFDDHASLTLGPNTFSGKGDCSPGSGTLCDFFTNVSPAFQGGNRWVSLTPTYKTDIDIRGNTASVYFECHFFDDGLAPRLSVVANATAKKVGGKWVFAEFNVSLTGVPHP